MDIPDVFAAFCLDRAVYDYCSALETALKEVEGKTNSEIQRKSDRLFRKWMDMPAEYRDPMKSGNISLPSAREES